MTILFNCTYTLTFTTSSCHTADEMMTFRRAGQPSPPPSPLTVPEEASTKDESKIAKVCNGQEEMGNFMDALMQSTLEKIGVDQRMANLAPSQQMMIAERIHKAKEGFLGKQKLIVHNGHNPPFDWAFCVLIVKLMMNVCIDNIAYSLGRGLS